MKNDRKDQFEPQVFATYWINYTSRHIQKRFEKVVRPLGFGLAYVGVATELEKSGSLLQRDLAIQYGIEQPTMAALLTRMERDGLVSRKMHPEDKRASLISLTAKGKSKLPKVKKKLVEEAQAAAAGLSDSETEMFISLLKRVVKNLDNNDSEANLKVSKPSRSRR